MLKPARGPVGPALLLAVLAWSAPAAVLGAPRSTPARRVTFATLARWAMPEAVSALAYLSDNRLLALSSTTVTLLRTDASDVTPLARLTLAGPARAARWPAGLLSVDHEATTAWVLSNRSARAWLIDWSDDRLVVRGDAEALPVPSSSASLRFREGTSWLDGEPPYLGAGPFLALEFGGRGWAVDASARLRWAEAKPARAKVEGERPRVGPTLAALWPGWVATATAHLPGAGDALLVFAFDGKTVHQLSALPCDDSIRALAARPAGTHMRVAMATEEPTGQARLTLLEIRRGEP